MSKVDYSKWDKIELSDDEDIECHPNIDKASWVRLMQQKIHRERAERKQRIAQMKAEHSTNTGLRQRLVTLQTELKQNPGSETTKSRVEKLVGETREFDKVRKGELLNPDSEQFMQAKDTDEVFVMLMSRLLDENKLDRNQTDAVVKALPDVVETELPKLDKRQAELLKNIAKEEHEQNKKLTSENIGHEGFSKTIINPGTSKMPPISAADSTKTGKMAKGKEKKIEVLNPGFEDKPIPASASSTASQEETDDFGLRELSLAEEKILLDFASKPTFEDSFRHLQQYPELVTREYSDQLMARAFQLQMKNRSKEAKNCVKWSLALNYSMQLGPQGVGMFYKRMMSGQKEAVQFFEEDLERTFAHLKERSKVLAEKHRSDKLSPENSNLTPDQAKVFVTFPKYFQDAFMSADMDEINAAFAKMGQEEAKRVMEECQRTGLIQVMSQDEANTLIEKEKSSKGDAGKVGIHA